MKGSKESAVLLPTLPPLRCFPSHGTACYESGASIHGGGGGITASTVVDVMDFFTGASSAHSWRPTMPTAHTAAAGYWFNWRAILAAASVLSSASIAVALVWRNEGRRRLLHGEEVWRPCLTEVHPAWLLLYRLLAFFVLLSLIVVDAYADGPSIFFYYTQLTFSSVIVYFGLGSVLSLHGCYKYHNRAVGDGAADLERVDLEQGTPPSSPKQADAKDSRSHPEDPRHEPQPAGFSARLFHVLFQMNAGAVVLTDFVFWFIFVPLLVKEDYSLNLLVINMHTINAVFLVGEATLNCLPFAWFRIGYFVMWTVAYVVFQWILHASISFWWPYPFLDLSSPWAPLWYFSVALMHIPCYGIFLLLMRMKDFLLGRWFPYTYRQLSHH